MTQEHTVLEELINAAARPACEKYTLVYPIYGIQKTVIALDGAAKQVGEFPLSSTLKKIFRGKTSLKCKGYIDSNGTFQLVKIM